MSAAAIVVTVAASAAFARSGRWIAGALPPNQATWMLSVGAVLAALSPIAVLALVAAVVIGQLPVLADAGRWSATALQQHALTEPAVGALAGVLTIAGLIAAGRSALRQIRVMVDAHRSLDAIAGPGPVAVVDGAPAGAVAVPGRPGRVIVARSLLAALPRPERRVLLAHERAHLEHGHHWHRLAVSLAAAANPLLSPLRGAVVFASERSADEHAARELGDRRRTAAAVARVALVSQRMTAPQGAQFVDGDAIVSRVRSLMRPAPTGRPAVTLGLGLLLVLGVVAVAIFAKQTEHLFELAGDVWRAGHG